VIPISTCAGSTIVSPQHRASRRTLADRLAPRPRGDGDALALAILDATPTTNCRSGAVTPRRSSRRSSPTHIGTSRSLNSGRPAVCGPRATPGDDEDIA
jgi:hypothetical protein